MILIDHTLPGTTKSVGDLKNFIARFYKSYEKFGSSKDHVQVEKFNEMVEAFISIAKSAKIPNADSINWSQEALSAKVFSSTGDAEVVISSLYLVYKICSWGEENDVMQITSILQHPLMRL